MAKCETCEHVKALHGAGTGACRLNGCPCRAFGVAVWPIVELEPPSTLDELRLESTVRWLNVAVLAGPAVIALIVGILIGTRL